jgi:hypothetical protein
METAPIRYVAELIGADADSERIIRWLIAFRVARMARVNPGLPKLANAFPRT